VKKAIAFVFLLQKMAEWFDVLSALEGNTLELYSDKILEFRLLCWHI